QQGCTGSGWADHRGVRDRPEEQSVPGLEPDGLGVLLPSCGARGANSEGRWRHQGAGCGHGRGPDRPNGGSGTAGGEGGADVPPRLLRLPPGAFRVGRGRGDPTARCWRKDWVLDLDIKSFFDSVDHDLLVKAVEANTDDVWVVLYIKRWLKAPPAHPDGTLQARDRGTPQGSAVSPVLANLFMHYAFDAWMDREHPGVTFCRYVDDVVVHAVTLRQAERLRSVIAARMAEVGLMLHPVKTKIVY